MRKKGDSLHLLSGLLGGMLVMTQMTSANARPTADDGAATESLVADQTLTVDPTPGDATVTAVNGLVFDRSFIAGESRLLEGHLRVNSTRSDKLLIVAYVSASTLLSTLRRG